MDADLTCRACGHKHTQADWEYQAGHCHACGAPLAIPDNDPSYAQWVTGPKSKAAIELEQAAEIAKRSEPDPGPLPPPTPPTNGAPVVAEEPHEEDEEENEPEPEGVQIPDDIQVTETGKLKHRKRTRRKS